MPLAASSLNGNIVKLAFVYASMLSAILAALADAQNLEIRRYNPSEWTKGRFSEVVTIKGPGKLIYEAGIGAEDEKAPAGNSANFVSG
jgi:2-iminobutanoate/2-iminopropanoate deaminase